MFNYKMSLNSHWDTNENSGLYYQKSIAQTYFNEFIAVA